MENKTQTDGKTSTESIGVTEMQFKNPQGYEWKVEIDEQNKKISFLPEERARKGAILPSYVIVWDKKNREIRKIRKPFQKEEWMDEEDWEDYQRNMQEDNLVFKDWVTYPPTKIQDYNGTSYLKYENEVTGEKYGNKKIDSQNIWEELKKIHIEGGKIR